MYEALDLLDGITVLDLGPWRPGPFAAQLLAELGAQVVKVEPPGGDPMRAFPALYRTLNERKDVVELDLKSSAGRERALELAAERDVVLEGFRPGVVDRLGVGCTAVQARNPATIYCSISGFGQDGPLALAPGHDLNYQAWAGVLAARLPEVTKPGIPIADLAAGAYAAMAICAALVARARTGTGKHVDVSMTDVLVSWAGPEVGGDLATGDEPGGRFPAYGTFACADGWITLGVVTEDSFWRALCGALELDALADLDVTARAAQGRELRAALADAIARRDRDPLVEQLVAAGVPAAPVLGAREAVRSDHARGRNLTRSEKDGSVSIAHPVRFTAIAEDATGG